MIELVSRKNKVISELKAELENKNHVINSLHEEAKASTDYIQSLFWENDNYSDEINELKKQIRDLEHYSAQYQIDQESHSYISEQKQNNPLIKEALKQREHYPTLEELTKEYRYLKYISETDLKAAMNFIDFIVYEIDDDAVIENRKNIFEIEYGYTEKQFKEFDFYCKQRIEEIELILKGNKNA